MDSKEKKLLALSIFIVLLSSWFIGNLVNIEINGGNGFILLPRGRRNLGPLFATISLILIPISYLSYISYRAKKENDFMFSKTLLLVFWILAFFSGVIIVIFGLYPLNMLIEILPNVPLPFDVGAPISPFFLNIGFILLLWLIGMFFLIYFYLKFYEVKMETIEADLNPTEMETDIFSKKKMEEEAIEDSLSSTLDEAIAEIDEGSDVRSTIINSYNQMTRLLEERGAENHDSMTPREFKEEIIKKIPTAKNFVSNITFLFEEARYSPHELEEKDREEVIHQLEELKEELQ